LQKKTVIAPSAPEKGYSGPLQDKDGVIVKLIATSENIEPAVYELAVASFVDLNNSHNRNSS